jgi:hypothetical protein
MAEIEVFHFRVYDFVNDTWVVPSRKSPKERVERVRGEIIPNTGEFIHESDLDSEGRFDPGARGKQQ